MNEKPNYYGILPAHVRYAKIKPMSKLIFSELSALTNKYGYCNATNHYFADLYEVAGETVSRWINELKQHGFISIKYIKENKEIKERRIYIIPIEKNQGGIDEKVNTYCQKNQGGIDENVKGGIDKKVKGNITSINNTSINNKKVSSDTGDVFASKDIVSQEPEEKAPPPPELNAKTVIDEYDKAYTKKTGVKYDYNKADFGNAKHLAKFANKQTKPKEFLLGLIRNAFENQWFCNNASISLLYSKRNSFNPKKARASPKNREHLRHNQTKIPNDLRGVMFCE